MRRLTALLIVVGMFGAFACGKAEKPDADAPRAPRDLPLAEEGGGALAPGTWQASRFAAPFSIRVGTGYGTYGQTPGYVDVLRADTGVGLVIERVRRVWSVAGDRPRVMRAPSNLVQWLGRHPYLSTSRPRPVLVDGRRAEAISVEVTRAPKAQPLRACRNPCLPLTWQGRLDSSHYRPGESFEAVVFDRPVRGRTLLVQLFAVGGDFAVHATEGRRLLQTVRFL